MLVVHGQSPHILYDHEFVEARNQSAAWYDPPTDVARGPFAGRRRLVPEWRRRRRAGPCCFGRNWVVYGYLYDGRAGRIYIYGKGAWLLYVMCLIPIFAILTFWYLVFTHEKVHCFNRKNVMAMISQTGA